MPAMLEITLFAGLACRRAGRDLALPPARRARALLAYLALRSGAAVRRDYLAYTLWPDSSEQQARTNLRGALFDLTRGIPDLATALRTSRQTISLLSDACLVDVAEFERLASPAGGPDGPVSPEDLAKLARK